MQARRDIATFKLQNRVDTAPLMALRALKVEQAQHLTLTRIVLGGHVHMFAWTALDPSLPCKRATDLKNPLARSNTRREMDLGLYIAATGMIAEQTRQDQLSNDLANATTPGFKADRTPQHSFGSMLLANTEGGAAIGSVDVGVALGKTYTDMTPASIQETGEPLDFALQGSGFFAVKTAQGVRYTRDGQFTTSAAGVLTDVSGNPVLDQAGAPVKVGASRTVTPSALGVFEVPGAAKQGENLYTGTAAGKASGTVHQGSLEVSGVDAAKVMVDMITSLRTFQSGQQAIQTIGQTLQEAASQVGSVSP